VPSPQHKSLNVNTLTLQADDTTQNHPYIFSLHFDPKGANS
jgi:hypothetical protein